MTLFRLILLGLLAGISAYTAMVISTHGLGLFPIFFSAISAMGWPGQFDLDFLGLLTLSGLWTAWRVGFGWRGLVMGLLAFNLGTPFLCVFLLVLARQHRGDLRAMLIGPGEA